MTTRRNISLLVFALITAVSAQAMDREQKLDRVREQLTQSCYSGGMASCLGLETSRCARLANEVVQACAEHFSPEEQGRPAAFGECIGRQTRQRTGVTESEMETCRARADEEAHSASSVEEAKRELEAIGTRMAQGAEATAAEATLPLYPNHKLTAHHQDTSGIRGIDNKPLGEEAVPVIMMTTPDSVEEVVAFYRDRLDGFTLYKAAADNVTFAKDMPAAVEPSDFRRWMKALPLHEHVAIYRLSGETRIEVGYRSDD